ncbi:unnamed protein product [Trichobilharzia regenti]|nr:unnamed protein product [Trichobilharzia regenti]
MRWGVPNVSQLDHLGPQTCYDEVEHCKSVSVGPPFLTVLGQRYGEYEIPFKIDAYEMELIKEWSRKLPDVSSECSNALDEWYLRDKNDINQAYQLKPVVESFQLVRHMIFYDQIKCEIFCIQTMLTLFYWPYKAEEIFIVVRC